MNNRTETAALLLRLGLGTMFIAHGLLKVMVFTLPGTVGFFEQVGFPGWLAYVVTFAEIGGGIMLIYVAAEERTYAVDYTMVAPQALDPADYSPDNLAMRTMVQSHRDWSRQDHVRAHMRLAWKAFFDDWDILLCPIAATTAFPHDQSPMLARTIEVDGATQPYFQQLFWAGLITVAYLPSTVVPTGLDDAGLLFPLTCAAFVLPSVALGHGVVPATTTPLEALAASDMPLMTQTLRVTAILFGMHVYTLVIARITYAVAQRTRRTATS